MPRKTDFKISLGLRIRLLRNINLLTQEELGKKLHVGKSTIANYESGYSEPESEKLKKLADIFNVSVDYLLGNASIQKPVEFLEEKLSSLNLSEHEFNSAIKDVLYFYSNSDNIINSIPNDYFKTEKEKLAYEIIQDVISGFFGAKIEQILGNDFHLSFPHPEDERKKLTEIQNYINDKIITLTNSLDKSKIVNHKDLESNKVDLSEFTEQEIQEIKNYVDYIKNRKK